MVATTIDRARAVPAGRRWNRDTTDNLWALLFIGPQVIGLLAFSAIPLLSAMYLSLTNWDGFGNRTFIGVQNFAEQLQSPDLHIALWNTLVYTLISVPGGLILLAKTFASFCQRPFPATSLRLRQFPTIFKKSFL